MCVFFNKNNYTFNKCLKTSETIARKEIAKQKRLCFLCLEKVHLAVSCKLKYFCNTCGGTHNTAICTYSKGKTHRQFHLQMPKLITNFASDKNNIFLQTASVSVCDVDNNKSKMSRYFLIVVINGVMLAINYENN